MGLDGGNRSFRVIVSMTIGLLVLTLPLHLMDFDGQAETPRLLRELEPEVDSTGRPLVPALILRSGGRLYLRSSFTEPLPRLVQLQARVVVQRAGSTVANGQAALEWLGESGPARNWRVEIPLQAAIAGQALARDGDAVEVELRFGDRPLLVLAGQLDLRGQALTEGRWWRSALLEAP